MRGYFHSTLDNGIFFLVSCGKLVYPENFPSTKFGTNDGYFFKKTADQTLVTEAHVDLDDKWRGGRGEQRSRDGR